MSTLLAGVSRAREVWPRSCPYGPVLLPTSRHERVLAAKRGPKPATGPARPDGGSGIVNQRRQQQRDVSRPRFSAGLAQPARSGREPGHTGRLRSRLRAARGFLPRTVDGNVPPRRSAAPGRQRHRQPKAPTEAGRLASTLLGRVSPAREVWPQSCPYGTPSLPRSRRRELPGANCGRKRATEAFSGSGCSRCGSGDPAANPPVIERPAFPGPPACRRRTP